MYSKLSYISMIIAYCPCRVFNSITQGFLWTTIRLGYITTHIIKNTNANMQNNQESTLLPGTVQSNDSPSVSDIPGLGALPGFTETYRTDTYVVGYVDGNWNSVETFITNLQVATGVQYSRKRQPKDFGDRGRLFSFTLQLISPQASPLKV